MNANAFYCRAGIDDWVVGNSAGNDYISVLIGHYTATPVGSCKPVGTDISVPNISKPNGI
jgi:hypothetical protein